MPAVRFGIVILQDERWEQSARRWRLAEEYGFDHAWTYDHLGWRDLVDGPWFDAVPTLTAAATVTSRIGLGTLVASPNFRHPVSFARQLTALDDISGGRFILGLGAGAGGVSFDARVLGGPPLTAAAAIGPVRRVHRAAGPAAAHRPRHLAGRVLRGGGRAEPARLRAASALAVRGGRERQARHRTGGAIRSGLGHDGRAGAEPERWWQAVAAAAARLDEALDAAGRAPDEIGRYLSLDASGTFALSSADCFADMTGRAAGLGFTDVITHWPRPSGWYAGDESVLETVAARMMSGRALDR